MNTISSNQLAIAFITTRLLSEMIMIPGELIRYGADRFWAIFFAKLVMLCLYLPLIFFCRRFAGDNFLTSAMRRNKLLGLILGATFSLALTATTIDTILNLQLYITDTLLNNLLLITGILIITGAAFYGAIKGISAITRTAVFAFVVFVVLIALIMITMGDKLNFVYLYPSFIEDRGYFFEATLAEISENSEILIFAVLCSRIKEKAEKTIYCYLAVIFVLLELINLLYNLILGPYLTAVEYPMYMISSLSDIVIFQRLDGIDAIVWLLCGIIKIALLLACADNLYMTSAKKQSRYLFLSLYTLLVLAICWFIGSDRRYFDFFENSMHLSIHIFAGGFLIPLIALIAGKKRERKEEK